MNYLFINVTTLFDAFRSGTEEEYTELQQLLHDINSFKRDMEELKNKEIMKKKQKQKQDREKGLQMREAALSGMAKGKCDSDDTSSSSENEESTSTDSKKGVVKYRFQIVLIAQHFLSVYCFGQG